MSQEYLAIKSGLTREYISKLENNHSSPTVETLTAICVVLGVPPSQLISRLESP